jgi:hypothetical protein
MKTVIFKDYSEFLNRTDKSVNGVSVAFAEQNPEYKEQNQTNQGCWNCMGCSDCIDCRGCSDCSYCMGCRGCSDCSYCMGCSDCSDCSNFNYNPQRIISPVIGSRNDQTTYYFTSDHGQVVCGCFEGSMEEFEKAVNYNHGDNEHGKAYRHWIQAVRQYVNTINTLQCKAF